ncbi:hypothetical protein QO207_16335 [Pseudomonas sp. CAN2814]|uniref:hypothetical protein n=1 Tax=Pseudomonas sp. CAN1 TaxID=3046726 RepID=UPI00264748FE|nr:hypothetical protein [Pseudomonas sp. CAN1]MDN6858165.1 hypothetical protein [Pseudomonas sp. CAN1]
MQYDGLAWVVAILALLALVVAARILFDRHWFLGWLRGSAGMLFVALAALVALVAWDLHSYAPLPQERPLATLSFHKVAEQHYDVTLLEGDAERHVELAGDLWQLDARVLEWKGLARLIGLAPGYRLQDLSGRFLAVEQQALGRKVPLADEVLGIDLWRWLRDGQHDLLTFVPKAGRVNYLPMADQAVFAVRYGPGGLTAEPMNAAAIQALKTWQ